jgi:hypothetical protein
MLNTQLISPNNPNTNKSRRIPIRQRQSPKIIPETYKIILTSHHKRLHELIPESNQRSFSLTNKPLPSTANPSLSNSHIYPPSSNYLARSILVARRNYPGSANEYSRAKSLARSFIQDKKTPNYNF